MTGQCFEHRHRSYNTLARCLWPRAAWVDGEDRYALLAHCRDLTVTLWPTRRKAERENEFIDGAGCGGACYREHKVIRLTLEAEL